VRASWLRSTRHHAAKQREEELRIEVSADRLSRLLELRSTLCHAIADQDRVTIAHAEKALQGLGDTLKAGGGNLAICHGVSRTVARVAELRGNRLQATYA
jgi:hypothetical protein